MRSEESTVNQGGSPPAETETDMEYWVSGETEGKKLEDEYLLGDIIGRGNSSVVYRCLRKGRTEWACKILKKKQLNKKSVQTHMKSLLKLKHPNIVRIKEVFETKDNIQLILELAQGDELFERIVERGHYSEEDVAGAIRNILSALQYLHSHDVIHTDLKPENLLYQTDLEDSALKVADYGMRNLLSKDNFPGSRPCGNLGYSGQRVWFIREGLALCGEAALSVDITWVTVGMYTPDCSRAKLAPEIILNKEFDSSADMWSVGVICYIMLCGFEPFWDDAGEAAVSKKIIQGDYSFPSPWWDEVSDSAKELISQLLSVDPNSRPTAEEALNHPWALGISVPKSHMIQTIVRLREFNAKRRFRVVTKAVLATCRALNLRSPAKKPENEENKTEFQCFCQRPKDGRTEQIECNDVKVCCDCSLIDGSVGGASNESLPLLPTDGKDIGKNSTKLATKLSAEYKENYVGLG